MYIGSTPTTQNFIAGTDYFNGDGSTVAFTLSRSVNSVNDIEAVINNVVQQPNTAYTVSGTTITFTSAPSSGSSNIYVRYLSTTTQAITPSQGTVSYQSFNSDNQSKLGISFKNRIINGAMVIDQRNAGASVTNTAGAIYTVDRWYASASQASKFTIQQNAGSVTPPVGFSNYLGCTSSSAYSVGASENFVIAQKIEGFNTADLNFGTINAKTLTLSFWVRSSLTGTFGGSLNNSAFDRSYPFSFSISSANTWEQKSITIAGDASGTWVGATNGTGLIVLFSLGTGSTLSNTSGAWAAGTYVSATGATSVVGTNGATFYITGVQLEVGTQATTFDYRSYGQELALCQRYFCSSFSIGTAPANNADYATQANSFTAATYTANQAWLNSVYFPVQMRAVPNVLTFYSTNLANTSARWAYYASGVWTASSSAMGTAITTPSGFSANLSGSWSANQGVMVVGAWSASAEL